MNDSVRLNIESLTFPPETADVLKNIDLTVARGDFIAITGDAASGKSMLLHSITGAAVEFFNGELQGTVRVMGHDVADIPLTRMCDHVGYMMQEPQNQIVNITVADEVAFGVANMNLSLNEIKKRTSASLRFVGLDGFEGRSTDGLSGGQAQRAVLAGVLAMETPLLILDQPTAELDEKGKQELFARLKYLNKEKGVTVVMVMDRATDILAYSNRILIMGGGEIIEECSPDEYRKRLCAKSTPRLSPAKKPAGSTNIELRDVSFTYDDGFVGCENIDISINEGDFAGIVGINGSGKTTLIKLMEGLLKPESGSIEVFNTPLIKKNLSALRSRIGFLFQNPDLQIFATTVKDEVAFTLKMRKLPAEDIREKVQGILTEVGLASYADVHPQRLSRSQRQKLAVASILVGDPDIIIADEPTSGLDENQSILIMDLLADFHRKGKTVVLVTHDLPLARSYTTRIVAMHEHRVAVDIPTEETFSHGSALKRIGLDFQREELANDLG
ncbi:MAG: ATP-binding cassette domain-containing protein [Actinobacteria bacterium]|nr:ATP-binding cassette domain-containing protein [Actinomycetota bacterium]